MAGDREEAVVLWFRNALNVAFDSVLYEPLPQEIEQLLPPDLTQTAEPKPKRSGRYRVKSRQT